MPFTVELVVALYYVDENLEEQFVEATRRAIGDNSSPSTSSLIAVQHFCKSVNKQVRLRFVKATFLHNTFWTHMISFHHKVNEPSSECSCSPDGRDGRY